MLPRQLAVKLGQLQGFENPRADLEQWRTPGGIAAEVVFLSEPAGKKVVDLGCGTGILAIAAAMFGASQVTGVDIDPKALQTAQANAASLDLDLTWVEADITQWEPAQKFDLAVMNPPYGSVHRGTDKTFVEKARQLAPEVFCLMDKHSRTFFVKNYEAEVLRAYHFPLRKQQSFHKKAVKHMEVDLLRFSTRDV